MAMVVRSNIMALNANRQLGVNNSQVSKNLEKLSSGFKINRAGDDASGLAISEKMKAQIKGLETASANSQDGISLVQTAEGALTEVHDMLNRMTELATKSANGTIQDEVDREAIQSEVDALNEEIDRISKSTNFNGINLLDGSLSSGATKSTTTGNNAAGNPLVAGAGSLTDVGGTRGVYSYSLGFTGVAKATGKLTFELGLSDGSTRNVEVDLVNAGTVAGIKTAIENAFAADTELSKLFDITIGGTNADADNPLTFQFTAKEAGTGALALRSVGLKEQVLNADGTYSAAAAGSVITTDLGIGTTPGKAATDTAATNAYKQINFGSATNAQLNGKSITIGDKTYELVSADKLYDVKDGSIAVVMGADRAETMKNLAAALKKNGVSTAEADGANIKIGNLDEIKSTKGYAISSDSVSGVTLGGATAVDGQFTVDTVDYTTAGASNSFTVNYVDKDGKNQSVSLNLATTTDAGDNRTALADAINNNAVLKELFTVTADNTNDKLVFVAKGDKNGAQVTSMSSATAGLINAAANVANNATETVRAFGAGQTIDINPAAMTSGDTVTVNGKTYEFVKAADLDKVGKGNTAVVISENATPADAKAETAKAFAAALTSNGVSAKVDASNKVLIEYDGKSQSGQGGLTLQIGDTGDDFNRVTVSVEDMSATGLGLKGLDVSNADSARASIGTIKKAINQVSTNRANLGALQNRLEHTINNLDVAAENMTAANSRVRDTDMAKQMMDYTKMNVLTQAAQAMLAQANQQPQSILQLLQ